MADKAEVTPEIVTAVLALWVLGFVVDVPAQHVGGQYLIDVVDLESYVRTIPEETAKYIADAVNSFDSLA